MARDEELPENVDLDSEGIPPLEGALPDRIRPDDQPALWSTSSKSHPARSTATLTATRARRSERRATDPAPHGRVAPAHSGRKSRGPVIAVGRRRDLSHAGKRAITKLDFARGFQEVSAKARIEAT